MPISTTVIALFMATAGIRGGADSSVTVPLDHFKRLSDEQRELKKVVEDPPPPPLAYAFLQRSVVGAFHKGLFRGTVSGRFQVHAPLPQPPGTTVAVPLIGGNVSLERVRVAGHSATLDQSYGSFRARVDRPGTFDFSVDFIWGEERQRFLRQLRLHLPGGGAIEFDITLPEAGVEATLAHGVLLSSDSDAVSTKLRGYLAADGTLNLAWKRRLTEDASEQEVRRRISAHGVFRLGESVIGGSVAYHGRISEGETDRFSLLLPPGTEVLGVEGDAVLQWQTRTTAAGAEEAAELDVLMRYFIKAREDTHFRVRFQLPINPDAAQVTLALPMPKADEFDGGLAGIEAPAGTEVSVIEVRHASALSLRDVPSELARLAGTPLQHAFTLEPEASIDIRTTRHSTVEVTSAIIDDLQAATVMLEDGTVVSKMRMRVRNNRKQYLRLQLPEGAEATLTLVDGAPIRPAKLDGRLLIPLQQSKRLNDGQNRLHTVQHGETLTDIANFYFSDPNQWRRIQEHNAHTSVDGTVYVGQRLTIPTANEGRIEESSFVVDVAYRLQQPALGLFGRRQARLAQLDIDVVDLTWHVYFPVAFLPTSFSGNTTQYSFIRYDLFRRLRTYIDRAFSLTHDAWAGGTYKSILHQRRKLYSEENLQSGEVRDVVSSFPLVGQRYKFRSLLIDKGSAAAGATQQPPYVDINFVSRTVHKTLRWVVLFFSGFLAFFLSRRPSPRRFLISVLALVVLLRLGHTFDGVHRRMVWGFVIGLGIHLLGHHGPPVWARIQRALLSPNTYFNLLRLRSVVLLGLLLIVTTFLQLLPMLWSLSALTLLLALRLRDHQRETRAGLTEASP